jgi:hexosaminidase
MSIVDWRLQVEDWRGLTAAACMALAFASCARAPKPKAPQGATPPATAAVTTDSTPVLPDLLPSPAHVTMGAGQGLSIGPDSKIFVTNTPAALRIAGELASIIARSTGFRPAITPFVEGLPLTVPRGSLGLNVMSAATVVESYELTVNDRELRLVATTSAGLFYGVQTIRQLLPYWGEYEAILYEKPRPVTIPALSITDRPRYAWRGSMLDVARHFFSVADVKRYIDLLALHKMNRLHLHLADDQGWRIEIKKWPELTAKGGSTAVGGGAGGVYTQAQYAEIVRYAADRFITIVPEIDMPGHTNAALASYAELNCNGQAPPLYTGTDVGFIAFCVDKEITYRFIDEVVAEIAAITPGPYFHIGGDEVKTLTPAQYRAFVERVQTIVQAHGKQMIAWDEAATATLAPTTVLQYWRPDAAKAEVARAPHVILSPANRAYLDMNYDAETPLGLKWAALIPVKDAYDWDPGTLVPQAPPSAILGVEAPIWSETVANIRDLEFLAMPRLAAIAELGWAPAASHGWDAFRVRLGAQGPRWTALGLNFYRAPEVPWAPMTNVK